MRTAEEWAREGWKVGAVNSGSADFIRAVQADALRAAAEHLLARRPLWEEVEAAANAILALIPKEHPTHD